MKRDPVILNVPDSKVKGSPRKHIEEVTPEKEVESPDTIRRNVSNDNFLKFQWAWTV
jgi:hypothetical protein